MTLSDLGVDAPTSGFASSTLFEGRVSVGNCGFAVDVTGAGCEMAGRGAGCFVVLAGIAVSNSAKAPQLLDSNTPNHIIMINK
jgi:hypothetical protein